MQSSRSIFISTAITAATSSTGTGTTPAPSDQRTSRRMMAWAWAGRDSGSFVGLAWGAGGVPALGFGRARFRFDWLGSLRSHGRPLSRERCSAGSVLSVGLKNLQTLYIRRVRVIAIKKKGVTRRAKDRSTHARDSPKSQSMKPVILSDLSTVQPPIASCTTEKEPSLRRIRSTISVNAAANSPNPRGPSPSEHSQDSLTTSGPNQRRSTSTEQNPRFREPKASSPFVRPSSVLRQALLIYGSRIWHRSGKHRMRLV